MLTNTLANPIAIHSTTIGLLLPDALQWVEPISALVNESYSLGESGMWVEGTMRTSSTEIIELLSQNRIIAAFDEETLLGCIKITPKASTLEFGQLAVRKDLMKSGIATQLIHYVERYAKQLGYSNVTLEILYPSTEFSCTLNENEPIDMSDPHTAAWKKKALLNKIYTKMNYKQTAVGDMSEFAQDYPQLVNSLAVACKYVVYEKALD